MERLLEDKIAVVTGGARRVGWAIALELARQGAHVAIIHAHSDEDARRTADDIQAIGRRALVVKADIADYAQVEAAFQHIRGDFGRADILVNNASNFYAGDLLDMPPTEWESALAVNTSGAYYCTREAGRLMREIGAGGNIVNIADNAGVEGWPHRTAHSVSKAGLIMLSRVSAKALAQYDIRVNCLVMGPILAPTDMPAERWERINARLPLKHAGSPEDAARAVVFACTSPFMTGAVIQIDGGEGWNL